MSLINATPTPVQEVCLSAAVTGLVGSMTETLRSLPKEDALAFFETVGAGLAHFCWSVEAGVARAVIKCTFNPLGGQPVVLSIMTVDLSPSSEPDRSGMH